MPLFQFSKVKVPTFWFSVLQGFTILKALLQLTQTQKLCWEIWKHYILSNTVYTIFCARIITAEFILLKYLTSYKSRKFRSSEQQCHNLLNGNVTIYWTAMSQSTEQQCHNLLNGNVTLYWTAMSQSTKRQCHNLLNSNVTIPCLLFHHQKHSKQHKDWF